MSSSDQRAAEEFARAVANDELACLSEYKGHEIYWWPETQKWYFSDTDETIETERPCAKCGKVETPEGHDPCLGTLPGIVNACCGHGNLKRAYLMYSDRSIIRGVFALQEIQRLRKPVI